MTPMRHVQVLVERIILGSRYISVLDPLRTRGHPYHLVQWCPPRRRPRALPSDAELLPR